MEAREQPPTEGPASLARSEQVWPYLTDAELLQCFGPGELDEVKDFAHRTGRDYLTATRLLLGEKRLLALKSALIATVAGSARPKVPQVIAEIRVRWIVLR